MPNSKIILLHDSCFLLGSRLSHKWYNASVPDFVAWHVRNLTHTFYAFDWCFEPDLNCVCYVKLMPNSYNFRRKLWWWVYPQPCGNRPVLKLVVRATRIHIRYECGNHFMVKERDGEVVGFPQTSSIWLDVCTLNHYIDGRLAAKGWLF